jgi:heme-degrading monooxygenase HmoA
MKPDFKSYYAVIFTSTQTKNIEGYSEMAEQMETLAKQQKGFLGIDSARNENNNSIGITVSYWETIEAIRNWKQLSEHLAAQKQGKAGFYSWFNVKVCKVEREYEFNK